MASPSTTVRPEAAPLSHDGGSVGFLLSHGFTGSPASMRPWGEHLAAQGHTVRVPLLPGHGTSWQDMNRTRWQDWYASVEAGADRLLPRVDRLVVGGLSMGAVLSLALAQRRPQQVAGVCALSTIFRYDGWSMPFYTRTGTFLLPLFKALGIGRNRCFMEQPPYGIKDETLRRRIVAQMQSGDSAAAGLPGNPWWSVIEMQRLSSHVLAHLGDVRAPCLVVHAREDDVSTPSNAEDIVRGVTHAPVELVMLDNSYHMITIDRDRRTVIARTADFVQRIAQGDFGARAMPSATVPAPASLQAPAHG
ncbi:MAG: alpha/beta fold hydrolase [Comamonadaceae bacterium]|nr:MAG: alpha/beta fold hydrolase [Comamonadaceae bacterium]